MGSKDALNAATSAYSTYGGLFKEVVKEVGMEKALALLTKQGESSGAKMAGMVKKKLGTKELDMKTFADVIKQMPDEGWTYEMEETPTSIVMKVDKCAFYEGLKMAELDDKTIKTICTRMVDGMNDSIKKQFSKVQIKVKFRTSPDSFCTEEFVLRK